MTLDKKASLVSKSGTSEYLTFFVNNIIFAINSLYIDSIASVENVTAVPGSNAIIDGIVHFRGTTIPVINLNRYLFNKEVEDAGNQYCVVCKLDDKCYAFKVDNVRSIIRAKNSDLILLDSVIRSTCKMLDGFLAESNDNITEVLNVKHIIGLFE